MQENLMNLFLENTSTSKGTSITDLGSMYGSSIYKYYRPSKENYVLVHRSVGLEQDGLKMWHDK